MARKKYRVNWEDESYPKIEGTVVLFEDEETEDYTLTLTEAKAEVIDHFQYEISHAREQIRVARAVRASDE